MMSRCHHPIAWNLAMSAVLPLHCLACTPTPLSAGLYGSDLCWGDQVWREPSLGMQWLEQTFDYFPSRTSASAPLIVYFHPDGARSHIRPGSVLDLTLLQPALDAGYAFATVEFRHPVIDDAVPNTPTDPRVPHWDIARATQFLRANAQALGFAKRNVFFVGFSRGALALWTAMQPEMAIPDSPDPVARESTRVNAVFAYQAQTSYRGDEYANLFLVVKDRAAAVAAWNSQHPKHAQFGSAIDSVDDTSPPVQMRYDGFYVDHLVTSAQMARRYESLHYPDFGPELCKAYAKAGATAECTVKFGSGYPTAFIGFIDFFAPRIVR